MSAEDVIRRARAESKDVLRVDRSPMNPLQWCLQLSCGHDLWLTARNKPKAGKVGCPRCATTAQTQEGK